MLHKIFLVSAVFAVAVCFAEQESSWAELANCYVGTQSDGEEYVLFTLNVGTKKEFGFKIDGSATKDYWLSVILNMTIEAGIAKRIQVIYDDGEPKAYGNYIKVKRLNMCTVHGVGC